MEDTGWPHAAVDDYVEFWEKGYYRPMKARGGTLLDIQVVFQTAFGSGRRKEAILMQKIVNHEMLLHLLTHDTSRRHAPTGPVHARRPGLPRPLGEQAPAHERLVPSVLTPAGPGDRRSPARLRLGYPGDPRARRVRSGRDHEAPWRSPRSLILLGALAVAAAACSAPPTTAGAQGTTDGQGVHDPVRLRRQLPARDR